jgi:hypothetical protein
VRAEGVLWACLHGRGVRVLPESERSPERSRSVCRVRPKLLERDDRWVPAVSG